MHDKIKLSNQGALPEGSIVAPSWWLGT